MKKYPTHKISQDHSQTHQKSLEIIKTLTLSPPNLPFSSHFPPPAWRSMVPHQSPRHSPDRRAVSLQPPRSLGSTFGAVEVSQKSSSLRSMWVNLVEVLKHNYIKCINIEMINGFLILDEFWNKIEDALKMFQVISVGFQALDSALHGNTVCLPNLKNGFQITTRSPRDGDGISNSTCCLLSDDDAVHFRSKRLFGGSHKNSHANGHASLTCSGCSWLMEGMQNLDPQLTRSNKKGLNGHNTSPVSFLIFYYSTKF